MEASCIIQLCVQWPQPGLWLQNHQTFINVAITNYWRANFSKTGPTSNSSLLWQLQLQGLHMHMYSNRGRKRHHRQNKWDIVFLEETTNPTDLNGATWQIPDTCTGLIRLRRKYLQFCCPTPWKWKHKAWAKVTWDSVVAMVRATLSCFPEELVLCLHCSVKPGEQVKWIKWEF